MASEEVDGKEAVSKVVTHKGTCHCGAVTFEVDAPSHLVAWKCNCSICNMKRNLHFVVPKSSFRLLTGEDKLSLYQFGTKTARHTFCSVCGVCSFYQPRSNPDGYGVTVWCIKPGTVEHVEIREFDGDNWEDYIEKSGIKEFSKTPSSSS